MGSTPSSPIYRRGGLMFPAILIVIGVMFLLDQFMPAWGISKTWPVLLVVIGVLKLLDTTRPPRPPEGPRI
ncbi:MAG: DUF5668 domain-containing protein [Terriglobia bacterium]